MAENIFIFVPNLIENKLDILLIRKKYLVDSVVFAVLNIAAYLRLAHYLDLTRKWIQKILTRKICYGRIILALLSFYYMPTNHIMAASMYILSGFLDAFDGHAARALNQATKFGAMLDMLTDRCGTMCLLVTLSHFYPRYMFLFQVSMTIDIACHWLHLHTTLLAGRKSHKGQDSNANPILRIYYTSKVVLFIMCAGNELFYSSLYLLHFTEGPIIAGVGLWRMLSYGLLPIGILKSVLALMQGYSAAINLGEIDVLERQESQKTK